jgi:hypothetical protein
MGRLSMPLDEVLAALHGEGPIPNERVAAWMPEPDLTTRGAVYILTRDAWNRIEPKPAQDRQFEFMAVYLLDCLLIDPTSGDWVLNGFYAGWELAACLKHWLKMKGSGSVIASVAASLTEAYLQGDDRTRNRIETSALEHIFEEPALRVHFNGWRDDPILSESYACAVEWGDAHPGGVFRA